MLAIGGPYGVLSPQEPAHRTSQVLPRGTRGMVTMQDYRVYTLDCTGRVNTGWVFESETDKSALEEAVIMVTASAKAEIWQADRLVGSISGGIAVLSVRTTGRH